MKALEDIKVLDLTVALAGPFCTMLLAAQGAQVINVDPPGGGYTAKLFGSLPMEQQCMINGSTFGNKKGITVNLKTKEGLEIVKKLAKEADVILSNFSPGTMDRLGLSYETIHELNPRAVYCIISGFGQDGPLKDRPAYDPIIQAMTGIMSINGFEDRPPAPVGVALADVVSGIYAAYGIMAALHARDNLTGEGQMVDVAMYDVCLSFLQEHMANSIYLGASKKRGNPYPFAVPVGSFETKEGKNVFLLAQTDKQCNAIMELAGRKDIAEKGWHLPERMEHRAEIDAITAGWIKEHTLEEVEEAFFKLGIPIAPIMDLLEVSQAPHTLAREMLTEVQDRQGTSKGIIGVVPKLKGTPGKWEWGYMKPGHFNDEVFTELLGMTSEEIQELKDKGVI